MAEKPQRSRASKKKRRPVPKRADPPHDRASGGRVHLYVGISLDGYIAAPDGGVDWLAPYSDARSGLLPFMKTIGCAIMGRVTWLRYERAGT